MCSVPKAHHVTAQGNALGKCETNVLSPKGAKGTCLLLTPFQGFPAGACFLGRCPRLSHCAALRQNPSDTPVVVMEQKRDKSTALKYETFAQAKPTPLNPEPHSTPSVHTREVKAQVVVSCYASCRERLSKQSWLYSLPTGYPNSRVLNAPLSRKITSWRSEAYPVTE